MLEIILFTGLLLLVQLTLPSTLGLMTGATSLNYLAGARDEPMENMPVSVARAKRAANNLVETSACVSHTGRSVHYDGSPDGGIGRYMAWAASGLCVCISGTCQPYPHADLVWVGGLPDYDGAGTDLTRCVTSQIHPSTN